MKTIILLIFLTISLGFFSQDFDICKDSEKSKYALCTNGKAITSFSYDSIKYFKDGFYKVYENGKLGFLDKRAQLCVEPAFDDAIYFPMDKRFWLIEKGKNSMVDSVGEPIMKNFKILRYYDGAKFIPYNQVNKIDLNYPLSIIEEDGHVGVLNNDGFDIQSTKNDYAWILRNKQGQVESYVTKRNDVFYAYNSLLTPFKYFVIKDIIGLAENGALIQEMDDELKLIDSKGTKIESLENQVIFAEYTNGKFGFITTEAKKVSENYYDFIERVNILTNNEMFIAYKDDKIYYFDLEGTELSDR